MSVNRKSLIGVVSALALSLAAPSPALASGGSSGGGGGGGFGNSAPSAEPRANPEQLYRQGVALYRAGEYRKAERALKDASREARRDPNIYRMLGLAHFAQEEWKNAKNAFAKAVRYNPDMHDARANLGIAELKRGKTEKAAEQMDEFDARLAACGETCPADLVNAAATLRDAMATASVEEVASYDPDKTLQIAADAAGDLAYLEAVRLINLGHYDAALDQLQAAAAVFGPQPDVLTYLGFTHRKMGEYERAYAYYSAALEVAPDHINANEYLGEYFVEIGDMDQAYGQLAKLESLCPYGCAQIDELSAWIKTRGL